MTPWQTLRHYIAARTIRAHLRRSGRRLNSLEKRIDTIAIQIAVMKRNTNITTPNQERHL